MKGVSAIGRRVTHSAMRPGSPNVRRWPYPFRAGFALSNDAEHLSLSFMEDLFAYVCGSGSTPFGSGLGLEMTTSTFFFSDDPVTAAWCAGLLPDARERPDEAPRLREYALAGWIDANHAFGDFTAGQQFQRAHAERVYEVLAAAGVTLPVFSNHGGVVNWQNVGRDRPTYHRGDVAGHVAYHTDLFPSGGVRYVWTDSMTLPRPGRRWQGWAAEIVERPSRLLSQVVLQDGQGLSGFVRLRGTGQNAPNLSSFGAQLDAIDWETVESRGAAVVVYQHLGVLHRVAGHCEAATRAAVLAAPEVYLAPFRRLASLRDSGRVWVAGLAKLLTYVDLVERVQLVESAPGVVEIHGLDARWCAADLGGLTMYTDVRRTVELRWRGQPIKVRHNGPDETGRYSFTVPITTLEPLW